MMCRSAFNGGQAAVDAAVLKIVQRHAALGLHDCVHTGGEHFQTLCFRTQQFLGEHRIGGFEKASQETVDEQRGDPVAQAACEDAPALEAEVLHALKQTLRDHVAAGRVRGRACGTRFPGPAC